MTHIQQIFVYNLRRLRKQKGITQLSFSEKLGLSPNYLNAVENGKNFPSVEILQKICDILEILPYELFSEEKPDLLAMENQHKLNNYHELKESINKLLDEYGGNI